MRARRVWRGFTCGRTGTFLLNKSLTHTAQAWWCKMRWNYEQEQLSERKAKPDKNNEGSETCFRVFLTFQHGPLSSTFRKWLLIMTTRSWPTTSSRKRKAVRCAHGRFRQSHMSVTQWQVCMRVNARWELLVKRINFFLFTSYLIHFLRSQQLREDIFSLMRISSSGGRNAAGKGGECRLMPLLEVLQMDSINSPWICRANYEEYHIKYPLSDGKSHSRQSTKTHCVSKPKWNLISFRCGQLNSTPGNFLHFSRNIAEIQGFLALHAWQQPD